MTHLSSTTDERIMTLHPEGKRGVNILRHKYDAIRNALLAHIDDAEDCEGVPLRGVARAITPRLPEALFPAGKGVTWYIIAVKQDLEARGEIEVSGKPQRLRRPA